MSALTSRTEHKRTAVLVVHGMGSQRPLDTVRGVVDAVWLRGDHSARGERRTWNHPELGGVDIDLPVITTNFVPETDHRRIDFHELYWAHLMSETRAVAVLLWLFELARMGPRLKHSIRPLYWVAVVFLTLLVLSISLLATQFALQFVRWVIESANIQIPEERDFHSLVYVALVIVVVACGSIAIISALKRALRLALPSALVTVVAMLVFIRIVHFEADAENLTNLMLPVLVAAIAIYFTMGWWGIAGLGIALVLSAGALEFVLMCFDVEIVKALRAGWEPWTAIVRQLASAYETGWLPWSITSFWSSIAAWYVIAIYLALYAAFLQPYLGDAARYFRNSPANVAVRREIRRQAVNTLESLHLSGSYDRIVVVAHSLGTVVAYDMLRAYYSRINGCLPEPNMLGPDFDAVDRGILKNGDARMKGREIIRKIAEVVENLPRNIEDGSACPGGRDLRAWLVTDFVTLGSPLTHAHYLMCRGDTEDELRADFERRTREREFPTCPPRQIDGDGQLTFVNPIDQKRHFHHGGQFALTRWTNLYFPVAQMLWGDAIGGPVGSIFGKNIADVPVWTNTARRDNFFAHVLYWDIKLGINAPHVVALRDAIDLADTAIT
jgi:hypothetical protein